MANDNMLYSSLSQRIVKDLDKAYFLPYLRSTYRKGAKICNDKKYMHFDYSLRGTRESDVLRPIRQLSAIGNAVPTLIDIQPDSLQ